MERKLRRIEKCVHCGYLIRLPIKENTEVFNEHIEFFEKALNKGEIFIITAGALYDDSINYTPVLCSECSVAMLSVVLNKYFDNYKEILFRKF